MILKTVIIIKKQRQNKTHEVSRLHVKGWSRKGSWEMLSARKLEGKRVVCFVDIWNKRLLGKCKSPWREYVLHLLDSACNAGDPCSILGSGKSPGKQNGYPLQYSCLENSIDKMSLAGYSPWAHKELNTIKELTLSLLTEFIQILIVPKR